MTIDSGYDEGGVRVLRAGGELDVATAPGLLLGFSSMIVGARGVVVDLRDVTFFDSSGVRLIDRLARTCSEDGMRFRVVAPPDSPARRVLEIVEMAGVADDDLATAVAAAAGD